MERLTYSGTAEAKPDVTIKQVLDKLAEYEDLEEQGRLIKLPCKVGDTVYRIGNVYTIYDDWTVKYIRIGQDGIVFIDNSYNQFTIDDVGKNEFFTQEEAKKNIAGKAWKY